MVEQSRIEAQKELQTTLTTLSVPLPKVVNALSRMDMPMTARPIHKSTTSSKRVIKENIPLWKTGMMIFNAVATIVIIGLLIWLLINNNENTHTTEIGLPSTNITSDDTSNITFEDTSKGEVAPIDNSTTIATRKIIVGDDNCSDTRENTSQQSSLTKHDELSSKKNKIKERYAE